MPERVAVLGAGVGGLAAASRLAKDGYQVDVYEKLPACGGRNNLICEAGFKFDTGPSFVMMPDFFEEIFSYCGQDIKDYLDLRVLEKSYKIVYADGRQFTVHRDSRLTLGEMEKIEPGSSARFEDFILETGRIYGLVRPLLYKCVTLKDLFNPAYLSLAGRIRAFDSYWKLARKYFKSRELCYAFTFEAMFMGVSPYRAPAFYSVITYADHAQKIFHSMGGMYRIPLALEKLASRFGANFHYGCEVEKIEKENGKFTLSCGNERFKADYLVVNADYPYTQTDLLDRRIPDFEYSCSTYLVYLGLKRKLEGLEHHNLFFSGDLDKNLDQIFKKKTVPEDPSFYVHLPTVTDPSLAPEGKEIVYLLIPVPNLKNPQHRFKDHESRIRKQVFDKINKSCGCDLAKLVEVERRFYPEDFTGRYNIKFGATFGLAHNLLQSAFFRPANKDPKLRNLYYVGASTQPGGGLPVVIAGSRIVAEMIKRGG
ncbi:MAG: phytoene desaturase family protein [Candidatus Omnitrophica bacterium]|jgi:phytoene desaturase|nr:phytoene desaturase family protein [Candidatus Omnitrophota bacterium]MDD3274972.1 phytoene desaturase family protein [Candidatus Omnitrophota bacterium]MDD5077622.1 phytoene desaturase family protein [Candidatus Omnitrophota bacterium]MDD5724788.1 phytoene desaturase family protein [Candidatus Omnitrophota bacterium]